MVPIKNITYETGVEQIFKLIVPSGNYAGEYIIDETPDGWNDLDSVVSMNEELFYVEDFIIGETTKLKFSEYTNRKAFNLIRNVYAEQGGDGRIIFKWIAEKRGVQYDLLGDNFELNLNEKKDSFNKHYKAVEVELIKSESHNKFLNRQETTVDLFALKDLDDNDIDPVDFTSIGYKRGESTLTNFYTYNISQNHNSIHPASRKFFAFVRSDDYQFGVNTNENCGIQNESASQTYLGPFVEAGTTLSLFKLQLSNFDINCRTSGGNVYPNVKLYAVIKQGAVEIERKEIETYTENPQPNPQPGGTPPIINFSRIRVDYKLMDLPNLQPGQSLDFEVIDIGGGDFLMFGLEQNDNCTIKLTTNIELPLVRTKGIKIFDALNQIVKSSTSSEMSAESFYVGEGGIFYNTLIATGVYLRGLPDVYLSGKLKTNFKDLFGDGISKVIPMGYDLLGNKVVFEDLNYFFKDVKIYDLSDKDHTLEGYNKGNDKTLSYNTLTFGSKKISTKSKDDTKNFVTSSEITTTIKTNKSKFDKQTNLIIDEYKIQELIDDQSSSTNDNDDDLVMIDLVDVVDLWDEGVFPDCEHSFENGFLYLNCLTLPFDTTMIEVDTFIQITEGKNVGTWLVLEITDTRKLKLNKTFSVETGVIDTPIRYRIFEVTKNRTSEGFTESDNIRNVNLSTNIRHNPKYHMARWFPWWGSGLRKKPGTDILKTTNYKNNSLATIKIVPPEMANELQGKVVVGADETLQRFRDSYSTLFTGEFLEITYINVSFEEFLTLYSNWKFGEGNDRTKSRGYISCNTPEGIYDVFIFGPEMIKHDKETNTLSIKGKIKGKSVDDPVLLSVTQVDRNTVTLNWDYVDDYINPIINIQYSSDGINWETIHTVTNVKTATFSNSAFNDFMTGDIVYFRVLVSTADYYNKISNSLPVVWQFNDWVFKEISKTENINCGYSYLTFEIKGTVNFEIKWNYEDSPGGGNYSAIDMADNSVIASFASAYGFGESDEQITSHSIVNETKTFSIQLKNSDKNALGTVLNCNSGNMNSFVSAFLSIEIKDLATDDTINSFLIAETEKRYRQRPTPPDPEIP